MVTGASVQGEKGREVEAPGALESARSSLHTGDRLQKPLAEKASYWSHPVCLHTSLDMNWPT
jgi:hypothetical protein